MKEPVLPS